MIDLSQPDPKSAVEFLAWLNEGAPLHIEHIRSEGPARVTARTYAPTELSAATKFVAANNADDLRRNIHYLCNAEFLNGKRAKENFSAARFLHVDLDYKDYFGDPQEVEDYLIDRILEIKIRPQGVPLPTTAYFTGGGIQALWRLADPISVEEAQELNRALLDVFEGGPGTHDPSRLLRLPCTKNWLNEKKRAEGRTPAVAWPFVPDNRRSPPISFAVEDFKMKRKQPTDASTAVKTVSSQNMEIIEPKPLPEELSAIIPSDLNWVEVIVEGVDPPDKVYKSRSERVFAAVIWLVGQKVDPGFVVSIILEPGYKISAHVLENSNPLKYAQRQVARALEHVTARNTGWPRVGDNGLPIPNLPANVRHALAHLGVTAQRNAFTHVDELTGLGLDGRDLNEFADIVVSILSRDLDYGARPETVKRELMAIAHENTYHPVLDYLDGLQWDGKPRLDTWLADYCGAERNELNAEFGSKFLIAGVRRIKEPGVKFDTMLVLEGAQGVGKSRLAATLATRDEWFCGSLSLKSDDKTKAELLARAWIVECQELDGFNMATNDGLKRFLATSTDTYRRAYARSASEYRRHCVIIGTTNEDTYLRDRTGNRRFWPVLVGDIDIERFKEEIDQLWAEAATREANSESITLSKHLWKTAGDLQQQRLVEDAYADLLFGEFADRTGRVSVDSIKLLLNIDTARMTPRDSSRIKTAMANIGWEYGNHRLHDLSGERMTTRKGYARGTPEEQKIELVAERLDGNVYTIIEHSKHTEDEPF